MIKLLAALLLTASVSAHASDEWSGADTIRESVYLTVDSMDWYQTRNIVRHSELAETNQIMGKHPDGQTINLTFLTFAIAHAGVSRLLPQPMRSAWQYATIGYEVATVRHNIRFGLKLPF